MQDGILATVTSAQRTGELQAPSVHEDLGRSWPDKGVVGFHPKPAFLPMVLSKAQLTQVIGLCPLFDMQTDRVQRQSRSPLRPVRSIRVVQCNEPALQVLKHECLGRPLSKARSQK